MAKITPFPDFYDAANPSAALFNDAAKAILQQLGGVYWDTSAYVNAQGNLDATNNLATNPGFRNCQKAEPSSILTLQSFIPGDGTTALTKPFVFGPMPYDAFVWLVSFSTSGVAAASNIAVNDGTYQIYVNGNKYFGPLGLTHISQPAVGAFVGSISSIGMEVRCGDIVMIDPANLTSSASVSASQQHVATLFMQAMHVRSQWE